jgi:hypothetical protein
MVGLLGLRFAGPLGQQLLAERDKYLPDLLLLGRRQVRPELVGRDQAGAGR